MATNAIARIARLVALTALLGIRSIAPAAPPGRAQCRRGLRSAVRPRGDRHRLHARHRQAGEAHLRVLGQLPPPDRARARPSSSSSPPTRRMCWRSRAMAGRRTKASLYALGRLALVRADRTRRSSPDRSLAGFARARGTDAIDRFAIANPEHAPYGRAAQQALEHAGLWKALTGRLVLGRERLAGGAVRDDRRRGRAGSSRTPRRARRPSRRRGALRARARMLARAAAAAHGAREGRRADGGGASTATCRVRPPARILAGYGFALPGTGHDGLDSPLPLAQARRVDGGDPRARRHPARARARVAALPRGSRWSRRCSRCRSCCRRRCSATTCSSRLGGRLAAWGRGAESGSGAAARVQLRGSACVASDRVQPSVRDPADAARVRGDLARRARRGCVLRPRALADASRASSCRSPGRASLSALVLTFAHTLGEFGVVLMVGGNIPGETRTVAIAIYDRVQAFDERGGGVRCRRRSSACRSSRSSRCTRPPHGAPGGAAMADAPSPGLEVRTRAGGAHSAARDVRLPPGRGAGASSGPPAAARPRSCA